MVFVFLVVVLPSLLITKISKHRLNKRKAVVKEDLKTGPNIIDIF
jgi:hypothetical protein